MQKVDEIKSSIVEKYELDNIDQLLLKHLAKFPDTTVSEMARLIDYSPTGTQKRLQKTAFKKALAELQESTDDALQKIAHRAINKLSTLIESEEQRVALKACEVTLTHYFNQKRLAHGLHVGDITFTTRIGEDGVIMREELLGQN